jgi:hypothetical protein
MWRSSPHADCFFRPAHRRPHNAEELRKDAGRPLQHGIYEPGFARFNAKEAVGVTLSKELNMYGLYLNVAASYSISLG